MLFITFSVSEAQTGSPAPAARPVAALPSTPVSASAAKTGDVPPIMVVQASANPAAPAASTAPKQLTGTTTEPDSAIESGGVGVREFQGDDVGQVLTRNARDGCINSSEGLCYATLRASLSGSGQPGVSQPEAH